MANIDARIEGEIPGAAALRDQALGLRAAALSSRAVLGLQRDQLALLRAEIASLRALTQELPHAPAAAPSPRPAPLLKEAASGSAPAAVSLKTDARPWTALPYAVLLATLIAFSLRPAARHGLPRRSAASAGTAVFFGADDDGANEALLLAHEWRLPGDERALSDRLDPGMKTSARPAWRVERAGPAAYRVSVRPGAGAAVYEFDVDLDARQVIPAPDTAVLLAPLLASRR